ncbi:hypothetical protein Q4I32_000164, partial [Leishmania shawi]
VLHLAPLGPTRRLPTVVGSEGPGWDAFESRWHLTHCTGVAAQTCMLSRAAPTPRRPRTSPPTPVATPRSGFATP